MATTLTVTIDDGGMHGKVNDAIALCASRGRVDRVSVLATSPFWCQACESADSAGLEISVHLNCSEPPFLGGTPFPSSWTAWLCTAGKRKDDVRREWSLQIERILSAGFSPTRLDSHRHLHHLGALGEVILQLAGEYDIGSVRTALLPDRLSRPSGLVLDSLARRLAAQAGSRGIASTASVLGFSRSGRVDRIYLQRYRPLLPDGECELVMHPAAGPVWSRHQPEELELMLSEWFGQWIREED
jgi:predicted glycoside hydrolase/deacetylase ChbG (UPF0249 family)